MVSMHPPLQGVDANINSTQSVDAEVSYAASAPPLMHT